MEIKCDHIWVYESCLLLSNPPQRNRICSKCGKKGRIQCGVPVPYKDSYPELLNKFEAEKNNDE